MKFNKFAFVVAFVFTAILFAEVAAHAEEADQITKITFSQPIQVPGQVLPAGTYVFKLPNEDDVNLVQIFSADRAHLYATLRTISAERPEPAEGTVVTLAVQPNGSPNALVKWFYPGDLTGHEFVYSNQEEQQLAREHEQTITVKETPQAGN